MIRRLVARTIAQQLGRAVETATAPFQHALSTRAGCECFVHTLQGLTELDPRATVVSIDGIGAYDQISGSDPLRFAQRGGRWSGGSFRADVLWVSFFLHLGRFVWCRTHDQAG